MVGAGVTAFFAHSLGIGLTRAGGFSWARCELVVWAAGVAYSLAVIAAFLVPRLTPAEADASANYLTFLKARRPRSPGLKRLWYCHRCAAGALVVGILGLLGCVMQILLS